MSNFNGQRGGNGFDRISRQFLVEWKFVCPLLRGVEFNSSVVWLINVPLCRPDPRLVTFGPASSYPCCVLLRRDCRCPVKTACSPLHDTIPLLRDESPSSSCGSHVISIIICDSNVPIAIKILELPRFRLASDFSSLNEGLISVSSW